VNLGGRRVRRRPFECQRSSYSPSCRSRASPWATRYRSSLGRRSRFIAVDLRRVARLRSWRPVHRGAAAVASGHLAFDFCGWQPPHQGSTLIFPDVSSGPSRYGRSRQRPRVNSPRPLTVMREPGCRPPVTRSCDGRRPPGESSDRRGESWGNHVIVHTSSPKHATTKQANQRKTMIMDKTSEPVMPRTLVESHAVLTRIRPARQAPLAEWLAYYQRSTELI
jgi:hypothetical protein